MMEQLDTDHGGELSLDEFVPRLEEFQRGRANDAKSVHTQSGA